MKLPDAVRAEFQRQGRRGGRARARHLPQARRQAIARQAAIRRWIRVRFGEPRFEGLGLPGGALIDRGLDDLVAGRATAESLTVSLAAPRLRREGVPIPKATFPDADRLLYRRMEDTHGALAHARYLAHLRQVASFADACRQRRSERGRHAQ